MENVAADGFPLVNICLQTPQLVQQLVETDYLDNRNKKKQKHLPYTRDYRAESCEQLLSCSGFALADCKQQFPLLMMIYVPGRALAM